MYLLRSGFNHTPQIYPLRNGYQYGVYHHSGYGPTFGGAAVTYYPTTSDGGRDMCFQPETNGFDNWKGNTLCGGQTYDPSKGRNGNGYHYCKLRECEVFQLIVTD